jgi:hypothetical protein
VLGCARGAGVQAAAAERAAEAARRAAAQGQARLERLEESWRTDVARSTEQKVRAWLLGRGGCHNRWRPLASCDHRDSITSLTWLGLAAGRAFL